MDQRPSNSLSYLSRTYLQFHSSSFWQAEEGYARDFSELTLQQILRRVARLLETHAKANATKLSATKDVTLLHPPHDHTKTFYPDKLRKFPQYRDYFQKKEAKEDLKISQHMYKGDACTV